MEAPAVMQKPRLFLIDTFGFIFRAHHARARSQAPLMRTRSGLPTEAVYIFYTMLRNLLATYKPEYLAAVFESETPTFREQEFAEYKANRPETPPELLAQLPYVRRLLEALRIRIIEQPGFEADDVIGALARRAASAGFETVIVSADKDLLQLVGDGVRVFNPMKNEWYDPDRVKETLGVAPRQVADLLALKGDAVDNIPGAPGIGDKGARDLVARFGSVEAALERAAEVERRTYRESLENNRDRILLSKRLATIDTSAPVPVELSELAAQPPDGEALRLLFKELEFSSFLKELEVKPAGPEDFGSLDTPEQVRQWLEQMPQQATLAVALSAATRDLLTPPDLGLAWAAGAGRRVPLSLIDAVRPLLENAAQAKAAHDVKSALVALDRAGVKAAGFIHDTMLYAFLLEAEPSACTLERLAERYLETRPGDEPDHQAAAVVQLAGILSRQVDEQGFRRLYEEIDLPLAPVLARMELAGIRVDAGVLASLSARMEKDLERLAGEIYALAGHAFNINSPQQLGKVLFEELKLPAPGRTSKTKSYSTAADVLEQLATAHPVVAKVLEYRQLSKLKGTYVDALPALINPATGRLHTSFNPAGTATGRLSSSNPNLQNIPIRTELGREIRAAFLPREGWKLLVADYSQIELRLLAHMSRDPLLVEAFRRGEDIHARTAAEVFGVTPLEVTPELRRNAKAVNFGIIYGLSPYGLAAQLGIPQSEAQAYIQNYFARYQGVKNFIDRQIEQVRQSGETRTLFGRRRPIPDINSSNANARGFAERTAVNTPLQGTAADLIKLAMIRIERELDAGGLQSAMLLQVHDELVFEVPPEELDRVSRLVKRQMENVCELEVPLVAEISTGDNWRDAK